MTSTAPDSVNKRLEKADKFLNNSHEMLRNDLIYYSALTDAISAIKSLLESYIYNLITQHTGPAPQSWLDAVKGSKLPELLRVCKAEHLPIADRFETRLLKLNGVRNTRTHFSPDRQVYYETAQEAIRAADEVRKIVHVALGLEHAPSKAVPAQPVASAPNPGALSSPMPIAASMPHEPGGVQGRDEDEDNNGSDDLDMPDDEKSPIRRTLGMHVRRFLRALGRIAAVLLLLIVGIAAGVGIMIPVASGNAPSWLSFATRLLPTPTAAVQTATSVPTATPTAAPSGPIILGTITVSPPVCGAGGASFQMHNVGTAPAQWAIGSPGAMQPMFALTAGATPQVTLFGSLASTSEVTVYVSGRTPVVLTTDGGAVQLTLPTC